MENNDKLRIKVIEYQLVLYPKPFGIPDSDALANQLTKEFNIPDSKEIALQQGKSPRITIYNKDIEIQVSENKLAVIYRSLDRMTEVMYKDFVTIANTFLTSLTLKNIIIMRAGLLTTRINITDSYMVYSANLFSSTFSSGVASFNTSIDYTFKENGLDLYLRLIIGNVKSTVDGNKALLYQADIMTSEGTLLNKKMTELGPIISGLVQSKFAKEKVTIFEH